MAKDISDIITLDPAEVFESSGGEVITQLYEKVMAYPLDDLTKMVGGAGQGAAILIPSRRDMLSRSSFEVRRFRCQLGCGLPPTNQ